MYQSETSVRVRYGETDQMGYVYYGTYAMYYEVARVESLRKLGITYKEVEAMGIIMPVVENKSKYLAPGRYDENLRIVTTMREKPSVRIKFEYEIFNEQNKLIHQGETLLVFIDKSTNRPCRPPAEMEKVLEPFFFMKYKYKKLLLQWNPGIVFITWLKRVRFRRHENVSLYRILKIFLHNLTDDEILDRANGVAFNFILAIFPGVIFLFTLLPYITDYFPEVNTESIMQFLSTQLPDSMNEVVSGTVSDMINKERGGLLSLGFVFSLYLSTNGMMALMRAFNACYRTIENRGGLQMRLIATGLTFAMAFVLFLTVTLLVVGKFVLMYIKTHMPEFDWFNSFSVFLLSASSFAAVFIAFFLAYSVIYYFGPAIHYNWRFFSVGSLIATFLSLAVSYGFSFYITNFGTYNKVYGSIGVLIALMVWIQLITIVLLVGYEVNISIHDAIRKQALWNTRLHRKN